MIRGRHSSTRGAALATAILLTLLLLTLGISFLTFCQHDLYFQRQQQADRQAQNLARAAIEYYQYRRYSAVPMVSGDIVSKTIVPGLEEFEIRVDPTDETYTATGRVLDGNGGVLSERVIFVPDAKMSLSYDQRL